MKTMGEIIKQLRKENNLSQTQLSEKIGVARNTISMWESNERLPNENAKESICDLFNVDMNYLYGKTDIKNKLVHDDREWYETNELCDKIAKLTPSDRELIESMVDTMLSRYSK